MKKYLKPSNAYKMKIGQHIRLWRDIKGIKQEQLAQMLEITPAALSQIENDATAITLQRIEDIADVLNIRPEQLLENPQNKFDNNAYLPSISTGIPASNNEDKDLIGKVVSLIENMQSFIKATMQHR